MFRKMRRFKQQITDSECKKLLKSEWRGVLSLLGDDSYPYGVPMNFYYSESEHKIYFHSALQGHKIDAIKKHNKASFTIFTQAGKKENHWSLNFNSVIAFGKISIVSDRELAKEKVISLAKKYFPKTESIQKEMDASFEHCECLCLTIEYLTGKFVNES